MTTIKFKNGSEITVVDSVEAPHRRKIRGYCLKMNNYEKLETHHGYIGVATINDEKVIINMVCQIYNDGKFLKENWWEHKIDIKVLSDLDQENISKHITDNKILLDTAWTYTNIFKNIRCPYCKKIL